MSSTQSSEVKSLRRQVAALLRRVTTLEQATRPAEQASESVGSAMPGHREWEKKKALMDAWIEYSDRERLEYYRENPRALEAVLENQRKRDAFLRERGIEPVESTAMRIAKQLAKEGKQKE